MTGIACFFIGLSISFLSAYIYMCLRVQKLLKQNDDLNYDWERAVDAFVYWRDRCEKAEKMRDRALLDMDDEGEEWKKQ